MTLHGPDKAFTQAERLRYLSRGVDCSSSKLELDSDDLQAAVYTSKVGRLVRGDVELYFFLNPMHKAKQSMKKRSRNGRPAKIAPLKPPKEIHDNTTPRCAMEATLSDHQMLELDESQEGLEIVSRLETNE